MNREENIFYEMSGRGIVRDVPSSAVINQEGDNDSIATIPQLNNINLVFQLC